MSSFTSGLKALIRSAKKATSSEAKDKGAKSDGGDVSPRAAASAAATSAPSAVALPPPTTEAERRVVSQVEVAHEALAKCNAAGTEEGTRWALMCSMAESLTGWAPPVLNAADAAASAEIQTAAAKYPVLLQRTFRQAFPDAGKGLAECVSRVFAGRIREAMTRLTLRQSKEYADPTAVSSAQTPAAAGAELIGSQEFDAACALARYLSVSAPAVSAFASASIPSLMVSLLHEMAQQIVVLSVQGPPLSPDMPRGVVSPRREWVRAVDDTILDAAMIRAFFPTLEKLLGHAAAADDLSRTGCAVVLFEAYGTVLKSRRAWAGGCGDAVAVCARTSLPHILPLSPVTSLLDFLSTAMPDDPTQSLSPFTPSPSPPALRPRGVSAPREVGTSADPPSGEPLDEQFPSPSPLRDMAPPRTLAPVPECLSVLKVLGSIAAALQPAQGGAHVEQLVLFNTIGVKMCARTAAWCDGLADGEAVALFAKMITISPCTGPTTKDLNELVGEDGGADGAVALPAPADDETLARNGFVFAEIHQLALACHSAAAQQRAAEAVMQIYAGHPENYTRLRKYLALPKFIQDLPNLHEMAQLAVIQVLQFVVQQLNHRPSQAIGAAVHRIGDDLPVRVAASLLRMLSEFIRLDPTFRTTLKDAGVAQACLKFFKNLHNPETEVAKGLSGPASDEHVRCVDVAVDLLLLMGAGGSDPAAACLKKFAQTLVEGVLVCAHHPEPAVGVAMERLLLQLTVQDAALTHREGLIETLLHFLSKAATHGGRGVDWPSVTVALAVLLKVTASVAPNSPFFERCMEARGARVVHAVLKCVLEFLQQERADPDAYRERRESVISLHGLDDTSFGAPSPAGASPPGRECTTSARFLMVTRLGWAVVAGVSGRCAGALNAVAAATVKALCAAGGVSLAFADLLHGAVGSWTVARSHVVLTSYIATQEMLLRLMLPTDAPGGGAAGDAGGDSDVAPLPFPAMLEDLLALPPGAREVVFPGALSAAVQLLPQLPKGELGAALEALAVIAQDGVPLIVSCDVAALTAVVDLAEREWPALAAACDTDDAGALTTTTERAPTVFDVVLPNVLSAWCQPAPLRRLSALPRVGGEIATLGLSARCVRSVAAQVGRCSTVACVGEGSHLRSTLDAGISWPPPQGFSASVWFRYRRPAVREASGAADDGPVLLRIQWYDADKRELFYQIGVSARELVIATNYTDPQGGTWTPAGAAAVQHQVVPHVTFSEDVLHHIILTHVPSRDGILKNRASEAQLYVNGVLESILVLPYPAMAPGSGSGSSAAVGDVDVSCGYGRPCAAAPFACDTGDASGSPALHTPRARGGCLEIAQARLMAWVPSDAVAVVMSSLGPAHNTGYNSVNPADSMTASHLTSRARPVLSATQLAFIAHPVGTLPESWTDYPFGPTQCPTQERSLWKLLPSQGTDLTSPCRTTSRQKACDVHYIGSVSGRVWGVVGGTVAVAAAQRGVPHVLLGWAAEKAIHGPVTTPSPAAVKHTVLATLALLDSAADLDCLAASDGALYTAIAVLMKDPAHRRTLCTDDVLERLFRNAVERGVVRSIPVVRYVLLDNDVWAHDERLAVAILEHLRQTLTVETGYVAFNAARLQKGADLTRAVLLWLVGTARCVPGRRLMAAAAGLLRQLLLTLTVDPALLSACIVDITRVVAAMVRPDDATADADDQPPSAHRIAVAAVLLDTLLGLVDHEWRGAQVELAEAAFPSPLPHASNGSFDAGSARGHMPTSRATTSGLFHGRSQGLAEQASAAFGGVVSDLSDTAADVMKSVVSSAMPAAAAGAMSHAAASLSRRRSSTRPMQTPAGRRAAVLNALLQCVDRVAWPCYLLHHAAHPALATMTLRVLAALLQHAAPETVPDAKGGRAYDVDRCVALLKDPAITDLLCDAVPAYANQTDMYNVVFALACDRYPGARTTLASLRKVERGVWGTRWNTAVDTHSVPLFAPMCRVALTLLHNGVMLQRAAGVAQPKLRSPMTPPRVSGLNLGPASPETAISASPRLGNPYTTPTPMAACCAGSMDVSRYLVQAVHTSAAAQRRWRVLRVRGLALVVLARRLRVPLGGAASGDTSLPATAEMPGTILDDAMECLEAALRSATRLRQYVQDEELLRLTVHTLLAALPQAIYDDALDVDARIDNLVLAWGDDATGSNTHTPSLHAASCPNDSLVADGSGDKLKLSVASAEASRDHGVDLAMDTPILDKDSDRASDVSNDSDDTRSPRTAGDSPRPLLPDGIDGTSVSPTPSNVADSRSFNKSKLSEATRTTSVEEAPKSYRSNAVFQGAKEAMFADVVRRASEAMEPHVMLTMLARAVQYALLSDLPWRALPYVGKKSKRSSVRASPATQAVHMMMHITPYGTPRAIRVAFKDVLVKAVFKATQERLSFMISDNATLQNLVNLMDYLTTRLFAGLPAPIEDMMNMGKDILNALECRNLKPPASLWTDFANRVAVWLLSPQLHRNFVVTNSGLNRAEADYDLEAFLSSLALVFHAGNTDTAFLQHMLLALTNFMAPESDANDERMDKTVATLRLLIASVKKSQTLMGDLFVTGSKRNFYTEAYASIDGTPRGAEVFKAWMADATKFAALQDFLSGRHVSARRKNTRREEKNRAWLNQTLLAARDAMQDTVKSLLPNVPSWRPLVDTAVDPAGELIKPVVLRPPLAAAAYLRGFSSVVLPPAVLSGDVAWPVRSAGADVPPLVVPSEYPRAEAVPKVEGTMAPLPVEDSTVAAAPTALEKAAPPQVDALRAETKDDAVDGVRGTHRDNTDAGGAIDADVDRGAVVEADANVPSARGDTSADAEVEVDAVANANITCEAGGIDGEDATAPNGGTADAEAKSVADAAGGEGDVVAADGMAAAAADAVAAAAAGVQEAEPEQGATAAPDAAAGAGGVGAGGDTGAQQLPAASAEDEAKPAATPIPTLPAVRQAAAESPTAGRPPGHDGGFEELKKVEHPKYRHSCMATSDDGTVPLGMLVHPAQYRLPSQVLPAGADGSGHGLSPAAGWLCAVIMERFQDSVRSVHDVWRVWYLESIPSLLIIGQHSVYVVSHVRRTESGGLQYCPAKISRDKAMGQHNDGQAGGGSSPLQSPRGGEGKREKGFPALGALARGLRGIARPRSEKRADDENPHRTLLSLTLVHLSSESGVMQVPLSAICEVVPRTTHHEQVALEVTTEAHKSYLFTVMNRAGVMSPAARKQLYNDLRHAAPHAATPQGAATLEDLQQLWKKRVLSNYDYILAINALAGRTQTDLNQYPVVPWVLADYKSGAVDLEDPATFRDLSKPMGALDPKRAASFEERYECWDDYEVPKFHYGSHYSTPMMVLWYLTRIQPHTSMAVVYQGGKLDLADRLFNSIADAWHSASCGSNTDIKELIPEFYTLPEFLKNTNNLFLGTNRDGHELGDVVLPRWAASAKHFVETQRRAIEAEHVSAHMHLWIDLIFGVAQRGDEARKRLNVFYHLTYPGRLEKVFGTFESEGEKWAAATQVSQFGQTPKQLFTTAHPKRGGTTHIALSVATNTKAILAMCDGMQAAAAPTFYAYSPSKQFEVASTLHLTGNAYSGEGWSLGLLSPGLALLGSGAAYVDVSRRDSYARIICVGDGACVAALLLPEGLRGGTAVATLPQSHVVFMGTAHGVLAMTVVMDPPVYASATPWTASTAPKIRRLQALYRLVSFWGPVNNIVYVRHGAGLLVTSSSDGGSPTLWTVGPRQGSYCASLRYHTGPLHDAKYMPSRRWLFTASPDSVYVSAMDEPSQLLYSIHVPDAHPTAGAVTVLLPIELPEREDEALMLTGHATGKLSVWLLETSKTGGITSARVHTTTTAAGHGAVAALLQRPPPFARATSGYYYPTVSTEMFASFHKVPAFYSAHVDGQVMQWGHRGSKD